MEGNNRLTDFSIDRILGLKPTLMEVSADTHHHGMPGEVTLNSGNFRPNVPVPVVHGCLQYGGMMRYGDVFYPYGAADFNNFFYPNSGVYFHYNSAHNTDAQQQLAGYHGCQQHQQHQAGSVPSAQPQSRQKALRLRTVFTDGQNKQLEKLFARTDYPAVEARAQVARHAGLSEETVRVWFKNRRARRKRSAAKAKSPSPPRSSGQERNIFTAFL